jgi:hypothetical protein
LIGKTSCACSVCGAVVVAIGSLMFQRFSYGAASSAIGVRNGRERDGWTAGRRPQGSWERRIAGTARPATCCLTAI